MRTWSLVFILIASNAFIELRLCEKKSVQSIVFLSTDSPNLFIQTIISQGYFAINQFIDMIMAAFIVSLLFLVFQRDRLYANYAFESETTRGLFVHLRYRLLTLFAITIKMLVA